jgi:hypothetical protein
MATQPGAEFFQTFRLIAACRSRLRAPQPDPGRGKKPLSTHEIGVGQLDDGGDRPEAKQHFAVAEKGLHRLHAERLRAALAHPIYAVGRF